MIQGFIGVGQPSAGKNMHALLKKGACYFQKACTLFINGMSAKSMGFIRDELLPGEGVGVDRFIAGGIRCC